MGLLGRAVVGLGAASMLVMSMVGATVPTARHASIGPLIVSASSTPDGVDWALQQRLDALATDAESVAGPVLGNDSIDLSAGTVDVWLVGGDPSVEDSLQSLHPGVYRFHTAMHSRADLESITSSMTAAVQSLSAAGVSLLSFGPDDADGVRVQVSSDPAKAESVLSARYGTGIFHVSHAVSVAGGSALTYRYSDTSPWNGGDFIYNQNYGTCTSGLPVTGGPSNTTYMLTAAHCFSEDGVTGRQVANGYIGNSGVIHGSQTLIGRVTVTDNDYNNVNNEDSALIQTSVSDLDFNTSWDAQGRDTQVGVAGNTAGDHICLSGAYSGEHCTGTVKYTGQTQCGQLDPPYTQSCQVSLVYVDSGDQDLAGQGDSGGPAYSYDASSHLLARGMIDQLPIGATTYTCVDGPSPGRVCSNTIYIEGMKALDQWWGVTPKTTP